MLKNPSLITRIAVGKITGFVFGLIGFIILPFITPDATLMLRLGILFWYTTLGTIIGVFGVITWHPALKLPMPWWARSALLGAWMNFVLTLFAYDEFEKMIISVLTKGSIFSSPFWFVLEGVIVGLIIGYFATRFGGEGRKTIDKI